MYIILLLCMHVYVYLRRRVGLIQSYVYRGLEHPLSDQRTYYLISSRSDMAVNMKTASETHAQVGEIAAGHIREQQVSARLTGIAVFLDSNVYTRTNHHITKSRPYIKSQTLRRYIFFPTMRILFAFHVIAHLPAPFLPASISWPWALLLFAAGIIWFLILCQHLHVIARTIPWILRQPVEDVNALGGLTSNFLEVRFEQKDTMYVKAKNDGIGVLLEVSGKVEFYVLSPQAVCRIKKTRVQSVVMFIFCALGTLISFGTFCGNLAVGLQNN